MAVVKSANTLVFENILAKQVMFQLDKKFVAAAWANDEFTGSYFQNKGDTVSVQIFPNLAHSTSARAGADITGSTFTVTKETLTSEVVKSLRIEVTNYEDFLVNYNSMAKLSDRIMYNMRDIIDQYVLATAASGAQVGNILTSVEIDEDNVWKTIVDMQTVLDEDNAGEDRALFISPYIHGLLLKASILDATEEGLSERQQGYVGKLAGFVILKTNNLPANKMIGMQRDAVNLAVFWSNLKQMPAEKGFYDHIMSEFIYGAKVFSPMSYAIVVQPWTVAP